jgi:hypothetical protein
MALLRLTISQSSSEISSDASKSRSEEQQRSWLRYRDRTNCLATIREDCEGRECQSRSEYPLLLFKYRFTAVRPLLVPKTPESES